MDNKQSRHEGGGKSQNTQVAVPFQGEHVRLQRVLFELAVSELLCFSFRMKELAGRGTPALEKGNHAVETFSADLCTNRGVCKIAITVHGRSPTVDL